MTELDPAVEQQLAALSTEDFSALLARTRPPEDLTTLAELADPKAVAAEALRRHIASGTVESVSKEFANHEQELNQ